MAEQKTIVITGASAGIGAALAQVLAVEHHNLALAARRERELDAVGAVAQKNGASGVACIVADVTRRNDVERIARETAQLFGWMPYHQYQFQFEDGAFGGLEHLNSVTIGTPSTGLARDPNVSLAQIAHEFFHTWNEVHLRPAAWIGVRHVAPAPTGELWWSEGVTLYCADLLLRSGAFALVVMDGAPQLSRVLAVRLTRLARDVGAAFVVTGEHGGDATGSSVRIRLAARDPARAANGSGKRSERTTTITLEKGGKRRTIEVSYGRAVARRLCAHPEVPDRRGVAHPERPYVPAPSTPTITSYPDKSAAGKSITAKAAAKNSVPSTAPRRKRSSAFVG